MKKILLPTMIAVLTLLSGYAQLEMKQLCGNVSQFLFEQDVRASRATVNESLMPKAHFVLPLEQEGKMMVDAFIGIDDKGVLNSLSDLGVKVYCEFDGFVTASIPVISLASVARLQGVNDVQISELLEQCTDSTMRVTHVNEVLAGSSSGLPQAYDGSGVVIGIIDSGFDYQHEAFKCADDKTRSRIARVYDPTNYRGHTVTIDGNNLPGSVFMDEQIDTLTTDIIDGTHGTHTTSIAAGTHHHGWGGMAPGADIVLCVSRSLNAGISVTEVANCVKYIYSYADSVGKPCVISVSLSANSGAHDGRDYLSRAVKSLVGPGRIFVISSGNNGQYGNTYACGPIRKTTPLNLLINYASNLGGDDNYYYNFVRSEVWVRDHVNRPQMKFHILDKTTNRIVWESDMVVTSSTFDSSLFSDYFVPDPSVSSSGYLQGQVALNLNSDKFMITASINNLKCKSITVDPLGKIISKYAIGISVYSRNADSCYVDSWLATGNSSYGTMIAPVYVDSIAEDTVLTVMKEHFYTYPNSLSSINSYAVNDSIISVGAYIARNTYFSFNRDSVVWAPGTIGAIYPPSSYQQLGCGPTGEALPTVTAPGYVVVAAGSHYSYFNRPTHVNLVYRTEDGYLWGVMSGTSMSAPTVAGIIAQWLQVNPHLSPSQIKDVIARTAIKDDFTATSVRFGPNGKIDALAGIIYLINNNPYFVRGDVNGNGVFSISDVTTIIDYLLGGVPKIFVKPAADANNDSFISIKDATILIDWLLDENPANPDNPNPEQ